MRLRYTLPALSDLASILDYISDRSPQGAARAEVQSGGAKTTRLTRNRHAAIRDPFLILGLVAF